MGFTLALVMIEGQIGMFVVETIARIRRAHFVQGKSIKAICRELRVSRKTVRKVIRSEATEFQYEREQQPMPRLGAWREQLDVALASNEAKPSRERLTLIRVFEELRGLGFTGGYDAVRRYARGWGRERAATTSDAFVPLSFAPGEAYQFDCSHEVVLIAGATVTVKVAHLRLCRIHPTKAAGACWSEWNSVFRHFSRWSDKGVFRRFATRFEKTARNYLAVVTLVATILWLR